MKSIIAVVLFVIGLTIYFCIQKHQSNLIVRKKFDDKEVIEAFKSMSISGYDFLKNMLKINNFYYYKILKSSSKTVFCLPRILIVSPEFFHLLSVETFNTSIHELKHIKDKFITNLKYTFDLLCLINFLIIFIHLFFIRIDNVSLYYNTAIILFVLVSVFGLIGETRARKSVICESENILVEMNLKKPIIKKVVAYLKMRIHNEIIWHNATSISMSLFIISILLFLSMYP